MVQNQDARIRTANYTCTDFICDEEFWSGLLDDGTLRYFCFGREICPETQRSHFQMWFGFRNARSFNSVRALVAPRHIEPRRGTCAQSVTYCSKEGDYHEFGDVPTDCGQRQRDDWDRYESIIIRGPNAWPELPARIRFLHQDKIVRFWRQNKPKPIPIDNLKCYWIYGPTNVGKSHRIHYAFPDAYKRNLRDKDVWRNYMDEDVVYYEDFPLQFKDWSLELKNVADRWPFPVKLLYDGDVIRPKIIVVTSNYSMTDCFYDRDAYADLEAIRRRFVEIFVDSREQIINFDELYFIRSIALRQQRRPPGGRRRAGGPRAKRVGDTTFEQSPIWP